MQLRPYKVLVTEVKSIQRATLLRHYAMICRKFPCQNITVYYCIEEGLVVRFGEILTKQEDKK